MSSDNPAQFAWVSHQDDAIRIRYFRVDFQVLSMPVCRFVTSENEVGERTSSERAR